MIFKLFFDIDIDIDLIRLGGLIGPICRSITSVLDSCLVKKTRWYTTATNAILRTCISFTE